MSLNGLRNRLRSDDYRVRIDAVRSLAEMGKAASGAVSSLLRCVLDADDRVASAAKQAIFDIGPHAVPGLLHVLCDAGEDEARRDVAAVELARLGPPGIPALWEAINSDDYGTRIFAMSGVSLLGSESQIFLEALEKELFDASDDAYDAAVALACIASEPGHQAGITAMNTYKRGLANANPKVRALCVRALDFTGDKALEILGELENTSRNEDPQVREAIEHMGWVLRRETR